MLREIGDHMHRKWREAKTEYYVFEMLFIIIESDINAKSKLSIIHSRFHIFNVAIF